MSHRPNRSFIVAHLSDPGAESALSFQHAVALAAASSGGLVAFHATDEPAQNVLDESGVPANVDFVRHTTASDDLFSAVQGLRPHLVVTATHPERGLQRLFKGSHAARVARRVYQPTLFLGVDDARLIRPNGEISLRKVLLPSNDPAREARAVRGTLELCAHLGLPKPEFVFVGVGEHAPPANERPHGVDATSISWERYHEQGEVAPAIADFAEAQHADLIVMVTDGRDSLKDEVLGSVTERVVRRARRPVLSIPNV